ncbi:hypothetical protein LSI99_22700 [Klebsiella quasipneumoniae subsp. similipneumoniae]|uniref:hypothetical protein n=1 Tax=Klebsiella quasipneumoniae TaxID=1463165 RepID=UPI001E31C3E4|nr:hypothetical protein [Klebsiella quasipneumoniae]MCD6614798.1 hypothetical protein [Klebsiella quasipneumoniae subsp. similipneumoniae]HDV6336291.1 hypothetical protein [Klebsiella michiganensis]
MMDVTNTENKEIFDQSATRLKGIKNLMTPSGDVMRVTDTDLKWFNHFYTFEVQGKKCYQSIPTIAKVMGRARSGAQERIDKLESLGLLTVGKETFKDGWRNTYTCTPIDVIVSRMTDAKVTPQDKKLKKSQLDSLLRKSEAVDALAINHGIKEMAKAIADLDLSDSEVMQFAFQITAEKLAVLGWNIETTAKEDGKSDEKVKPQAEQAAKQAAPAATPSTDATAGQHSDQSANMASESATSTAGQRYSVESDNNRSSDDLTNGGHEMSQDEQDDDPPFQPNKPESDDAPWQGMAFESNGRLTEAAYKWALTAGATGWRHACRLVWEKVGVIPPDEINEDRKPKFLM